MMGDMRRLFALAILCTSLCAARTPLLVIGVDGFRADYAERDHAEHILQLMRDGSHAAGLIPAYPSSTFPNFYAMASGLYPEHSGIVAMHFLDRELNKQFDYNRPSGTDGSFYQGTPIWMAAEKAGIRTATYFWVGSDAHIHGVDPTYYFKYDSKVTHEQKVQQLEAWLNLPEGQRPDFFMVYLSDIDSAGHGYGPDSPQVKEAVARVDATVGKMAALFRAKIPQSNIVVVADHGMAKVEGRIDITGDANLEGCQSLNNDAAVMLYCQDPKRVYKELKAKKATTYRAYLRQNTPKDLHYRDSRRIGDIVVMVNGHNLIWATPPGGRPAPKSLLGGMHGYDPEHDPLMRGLFIVNGPAFKKGTIVKDAHTVDIFPLLCHLLEIQTPGPVDGKLKRVSKLLQ